MPVRGFLHSKIVFGFKIEAYNFNKLLRYLKKKGILASDTILSIAIYIFIGKKSSAIEDVNKCNYNKTSKTLVFGI